MTKVGATFLNERYAYGADGNIEYIGENPKTNAASSSPDWLITRILYDEFDRVIYRRGPVVGSWDNRENLEW